MYWKFAFKRKKYLVKISNISVWLIKNKSISNLLDQSMEHLGLNCADIKSWREVKFQEDWNRERIETWCFTCTQYTICNSKQINIWPVHRKETLLFVFPHDGWDHNFSRKKVEIQHARATSLLCMGKGMPIIVDCNDHSVNWWVLT